MRAVLYITVRCVPGEGRLLVVSLAKGWQVGDTFVQAYTPVAGAVIFNLSVRTEPFTSTHLVAEPRAYPLRFKGWP